MDENKAEYGVIKKRKNNPLTHFEHKQGLLLNPNTHTHKVFVPLKHYKLEVPSQC